MGSEYLLEMEPTNVLLQVSSMKLTRYMDLDIGSDTFMRMPPFPRHARHGTLYVH